MGVYGAYIILQVVVSAILVLLAIVALIVTLRGAKYRFVITVLAMILISNITAITYIKFLQLINKLDVNGD